jgi:hypothetical protein
VLNERLLHRVQVTVAAEPLNGNYVTAVGLKYEMDAGANREVFDGAVAATPEKYRTRSAVTLRTDDLRARQSQVVPQVVGKRLEHFRSA